MKYIECLELIKKYNLDVLQLTVAKEVADQLENQINDYDRLCRFIYSCALQTEISVATLVLAFKDCLEEDDEETLLNLQEYDLIDKASYY